MLGANQAVMTGLSRGSGDTTTQALLHFDGGDSGTTITDSSSYARTWNSVGNCVTHTTTYSTPKFGTASLYNPISSPGHINTAHDTEMQPGTGDFSLDLWYYQDTSQRSTILWNKGIAADTDKFMLWIDGGTARLVLQYHNTNVIIEYHNMSVDTWYHIEFSRTSGTIYMFVDGVQKYSGSGTYDMLGGTQPTLINRSIYLANFGGLNIDEWRLQIGVGGHTTGFTPETGPY